MTLQLALGGGVASRSAIPDILTPARAIENQTFRRPRSAAAGSSGAPHFVVTRLAARECYFTPTSTRYWPGSRTSFTLRMHRDALVR